MKSLADYVDPNVKIVLVGNKSDMQDRRVNYFFRFLSFIGINYYKAVSKEDGEKLALKFNVQFSEASAKNKSNVNEIFVGLAKEILEIKKTLPETYITISEQNSKKTNDIKKNKKCCS